MSINLHSDVIAREQTLRKYLTRSLDPESATELEEHYLVCDDCYEELRAAELLMVGLGESPIERTRKQNVTVVRFTTSTELTATSTHLTQFVQSLQALSDTKVLVDLGRVSRIDSSGLGQLMQCYAHAIRNAGVLKLLNPTPQVKKVLSMTGIDSIVATFEDEGAAVESFKG
jgi:anti-sigma B factor antagonist